MFWKVPMAIWPLLWLATAEADPWNLGKQQQQKIATDWLKHAAESFSPYRYLSVAVDSRERHFRLHFLSLSHKHNPTILN